MNILILTGNFGMGHTSVANAVKEELEDYYNDSTVSVVDTVNYLLPTCSKVIYNLFNIFSKRFHTLYNMLIKIDGHTATLPMKRWFIRKFQALIDEYEPDLIVSTWPVGSKYIGAYKKRTGSAIPFITCITDITSHSEWLTEETAAYIVGDESIKSRLVQTGIEAKKIYVGGIPVKRAFREVSQNDFANDLTVRHIMDSKEAVDSTPKKEILMMGGGLGLIPGADQIIKHISKRNDAHMTLITGNNKSMFEKYNGKYENVTVLGFTKNVDKYMKEADMLVTKAGGITTFEAINTRTPLVILDPFLEQEKKNANFIKDKGIGITMKRERGRYHIETLDMMIKSNTLTEAIRNNMREISNIMRGHGIEEAIEDIRRETLCMAS